MKKFAILLLFVVGCVVEAFAKYSPEITFELGGTSYEKTSSQRVFNPDAHIDVIVPLFAINDTATFGIQTGYDFFYEKYSTGFTEKYENYNNSIETSETRYNVELYSHLFSLVPTLLFTKNALCVHVGAGVGINYTVFKGDIYYNIQRGNNYASSESYSMTDDEYNYFQILWITDFGLRYRLTEHLAVAGNIDFSFVCYTRIPETNTASYRYITTRETTYSVGMYTLYISPKLGICYTF